MAYIEKRKQKNGVSYRAQIKRGGVVLHNATFDTKPEAEAWAARVEESMRNGTYVDLRESTKVTLKQGLERYLEEKTPDKKGAKQEETRIKAWLKNDLVLKALSDVTSLDLIAYRNKRIKEDGVSGSTVRSELSIISVVYKEYDEEWGMSGLRNPMKSVALPKAARARDRRIVGDELERLCAAAAEKHHEMPLIIMLLVETAMRRSELVTMTKDQVDGCIAQLYLTKNGDDRKVPLSKAAIEIFKKLPVQKDGRYFTLSPQTVSNYLPLIRKAAGINGLRLHDLRHEAVSRLFEKGLNIMEVAATSGHKTIEQLRKYTHPRPEDIARKLG